MLSASAWAASIVIRGWTRWMSATQIAKETVPDAAGSPAGAVESSLNACRETRHVNEISRFFGHKTPDAGQPKAALTESRASRRSSCRACCDSAWRRLNEFSETAMMSFIRKMLFMAMNERKNSEGHPLPLLGCMLQIHRCKTQNLRVILAMHSAGR